MSENDETAQGTVDYEGPVMDEDVAYRAIASRDRRFEGRFVVAVRTTRVYCRPGCPARIPRRENVHFFAHSAAAESAGYRPCLRCRPDASPRTAAWSGTEATVSRALRLIDEGALEAGGLAGLSERLGVGPRHLRRLFAEHVGASPLAVAQTRRLRFARKLLEETDLPMTEVALSAGFGSVRRFNVAMRHRFGSVPSALRCQRRHAEVGPGLALRLPYKPPFDWESLLAFFAARATPGVERVDGGVYRRSAWLGSCPSSIEVSDDPASSQLVLRLGSPVSMGLIGVVERVRRMFDLDADPLLIAHHLDRDRTLARLLEAHPGLRVPGAWDPFELAVRAILGQQITVAGATTLAGRLARELGTTIESPGPPGIDRLFPSAEAIAAADLAKIGIPTTRARALRSLASAVLDGSLVLDGRLALGAAVERLTKIAGVGPWTAHYVAMRALGEPDAFPAMDLGLRRAISGGREPMGWRELEERAETWRPWRAYAAVALWTGRGTKEA